VPSRIAAIARPRATTRRIASDGCSAPAATAAAVAGDRDDVEICRQRGAQRAFDQEECRLGDVGRSQMLVVAGERRPEIEAGGGRGGEHLHGDRQVCQPIGHPGGLTALSGKAECDAGHQDRVATR
jgi:hypothetical protein